MRILVLCLCLSACAMNGTPSAGVWVDASDNTAFTFCQTDDGLHLTGAECRNDGEQYAVIRSGWRDGCFSWVVSIPSTGYLVTYRVAKQQNDALQIDWDNQFESGTCLLLREP